MYKHGESKRKNGSRTRLYVIWCNMIERCYNPHFQAFSNYGGRGIRVCDEWRNCFLAFREWAMTNGYDNKLTLDRIDNNGNYEPSNCKWSTVREQSNNRRTNRLITYRGETKTMIQWAETIGIPYDTFKRRLYYGWSVDKAIETPVR
jgi:hypothetical protein